MHLWVGSGSADQFIAADSWPASSIGPVTGWRGSDPEQRTSGIAGSISLPVLTRFLRQADINWRVLPTIIRIRLDNRAALYIRCRALGKMSVDVQQVVDS
jgi:hypothetical protein